MLLPRLFLYKVDFRFPQDFIETPPLSSVPRVKQYAHTIPYEPPLSLYFLSLSISSLSLSSLWGFGLPLSLHLSLTVSSHLAPLRLEPSDVNRSSLSLATRFVSLSTYAYTHLSLSDLVADFTRSIEEALSISFDYFIRSIWDCDFVSIYVRRCMCILAVAVCTGR